MSAHAIHGKFQKPFHLRWTWESHGGQFHHEIDHIIFNRRFCPTEVAVVPKFYMGSDPLVLRAGFRFSARGERESYEEDSVFDNIDEEHNRAVEHLLDSAGKAESLQGTKGRLSSETLELIRQHGIA
uniref:Uncharacterized protein n=1 Tax=Haemonchus contortus TaxID=6289 RepID=A0A7I4YN72_HAECO